MSPHSSSPTELRMESLSVSSPTTAPIRVSQSKVKRSMDVFRAIQRPIDQYMFLRGLQEADPDTFYSLLITHTEEVLPIAYTPTVGEACQRYCELGVRPRGLTLRIDEDRGRILTRLRAWPEQRITVAVVTDGERVLGLGDLGVGGMGISEGKILLYTAAAAIDPHRALPICLDVGTDNARLRDDPAYTGIRQPRAKGAVYDAFLDEFVSAVKVWRPHLLLQFEDFGNANAFRLLEKYRSQLCCFNDDIQGTASVTLAALLSAARAKGAPSLADERILFYGAGEAGIGIGELVAEHLMRAHGMTEGEARSRCLFMDSQGLVCAARLPNLQPHKRPFAHALPHVPSLLQAVTALRPTALVGVSAVKNAFDRPVLEAMATLNARPIIMPLSNPTSHAECTFDEAVAATSGRCLFASGSPFGPARHPTTGQPLTPSQANNAYIFPALGAAAILTQCPRITDEDFLTAASTLAELAAEGEGNTNGQLFPPFRRILDLSREITAAVAAGMVGRGEGRVPGAVAAAVAEGKGAAVGWRRAVLGSRWVGAGAGGPGLTSTSSAKL